MNGLSTGLGIHPLDPAGQTHTVSRRPRDHVDMGVNRIGVGAIGKTYVETVYLQGRSNPLLDLAYQPPDHLLFLNIQIVKREHMAARGHHHMAVG